MIVRLVKKVITKLIVRPALRIKNTVFKPKPFVWFKIYPNWQLAQENAVGYNAQNILDKCKSSLIQVRDGLALYERDSVLFSEMEHNSGLLEGLEKAAIENSGRLCVLDFGGSLGSSYYQNKGFLNNVKELQWCIVEQPHFVRCGKENFENDVLKFYYTIEECMAQHKPDVLLLSSVLQYLEAPGEWILDFVKLKIPYIIIDRTAFVEGDRDIASVQNVPEYIYKASYPCWFFNLENLIEKYKPDYRVLSFFDSGYTKPMMVDGEQVYWNGLILKSEIS